MAVGFGQGRIAEDGGESAHSFAEFFLDAAPGCRVVGCEEEAGSGPRGEFGAHGVDDRLVGGWRLARPGDPHGLVGEAHVNAYHWVAPIPGVEVVDLAQDVWQRTDGPGILGPEVHERGRGAEDVLMFGGEFAFHHKHAGLFAQQGDFVP